MGLRSSTCETGDAALIAGCVSGDARAWETLVRRYSRLVYSVPRRHGLAAPDSEDVMQTTFLQLSRRLDSLRDQERLAGWLATIAHRESVNVIRKRRDASGFDANAVDDPAPDDLERTEREHQVDLALSELGGRCERLLRALFYRRDEAGYDRIAEELDMPVGSVGPTRARCFEKLRPILERIGLHTGN